MKIFVGGSSSNVSLKNNRYVKATQEVAEFIKANNAELIYGGNVSGILGNLYMECVKKNIDITAVIPSRWIKYCLNMKAELKPVQTVEERKHVFIENAGFMIFLPGGLGTFEELSYCLMNSKEPICLVNADGFYEGLYETLMQAIDEKLIEPREIILVDSIRDLNDSKYNKHFLREIIPLIFLKFPIDLSILLLTICMLE